MLSIVLGMLRRNEWVFVSILTLIAFCLGCLGYVELMRFENEGGGFTHWDVIYGTLQLFIFNGPDATAGWPIYLQVVRLLAPFLLIYAAVKTIWLQVGNHVSLFLLRFKFRNFIVICGVGETGWRLAREYLIDTGYSVVVIDKEQYNPKVAELRRLGAITLLGDAMDPALLLQARIGDARDVFVFTGDEEANIAIAKHIHRLVRGERYAGARQNRGLVSALRRRFLLSRRDHVCCHIEVDAPDLYELFQSHPFFALITMNFRIKIFNREESVARNVFSICAPDLYYRPRTKQDRPINVLFLGFGALVREMLLQMALTAHYPDFRIPRATVLCDAGHKEAVEKFYRRFPNLEKVLNLEVVYQNPMTLPEQTWCELQQREGYVACYASLTEDVESVLVVRRLNRIRVVESLPKINFIVCLNQQTWIADVIDDIFQPLNTDKTLLHDAEPIEFFETLDNTITIDVIVNDSLDEMAKAIHDEYLQTQLQSCTDDFTNESFIDWEDLPRHKRIANQRAAAHLDVKLRVLGFERKPLNGKGEGSDFTLSKSELDLLAMIEHRRWMADKYLSGYVFGEIRDEGRMTHPDLKPWEELSESDRDKDRQNITQIPKLLAMGKQVAHRAKDCTNVTSDIELQVQGIY